MRLFPLLYRRRLVLLDGRGSATLFPTRARQAAMALAFALLLAGCAARRPTAALRYRFDGTVLYPPPQRKVADLQFTATGARAGGGKQCEVHGPALKVRWRESTASIRIRPGAAGLHEAAEKLSDKFEANGCLAPGDGLALASRILEHLPAYGGALMSPRMQEGHLDLVPPVRLRMLSPILPAGAEKVKLESDSSQGNEVRLKSNLIGYETAWYRVSSDPQGRGAMVSIERVEDTIENSTSGRPAPRRDHLAGLPPGYLRLVVLTRLSQADHNIVVVAASSRERLEQATRKLASEPDATIEGATLAPIPREVALLAVLRIEANGREIDIPVEASVHEAIRSSDVGYRGQLPESLAIRRPYEGKLIPVEFDPSDKRILGLILNGGEKLSW